MTRYLSLIGALAIGALGTWLVAPRRDPSPLPAPLTTVQELGHLTTLRVNHADVIEYTQNRAQDIPWTNWELRFGGTRVILVARGDCLLGTDLRQAQYESVDAEARHATLVLPTPTVLSARVNHESRERGGSYFYTITSTGLEPILPGTENREKAINAALAQAQSQIERMCRQATHVQAAQESAEGVLKTAFSGTGWDVDVAWRP